MISSGTMYECKYGKSINRNNLFFFNFFGSGASNYSISLENAQVLLEPNPNSTEETYKITVVSRVKQSYLKTATLLLIYQKKGK
jgi:hypothetical protein